MANKDITLKVYPSGFLGSDSASLTRPIPLAQIRDQIINMTATTAPDTRTANQDLISLYNASVGKPDVFLSFDYREKVLKEVLKSFGVTDIYVWMTVQRNSLYWSQSHSDWIDETLGYIYKGRPRKYVGGIWRRSLNVQENVGGPERQSALITELYGHNGKTGINRDTSLIKFVNDWLTCNNGFDDLLNSVNLIFGK